MARTGQAAWRSVFAPARRPVAGQCRDGRAASGGAAVGSERGATDRRRPDLADLLTPLRGGETVNMNESPPSPLLAGSFPDVSPHGGGNQSGQLWGRIAVGGERGVRGENLKGGGRVKEVVTDRTAGLQDRRRRGVAGAARGGEPRPATAGSRRPRWPSLRGAGRTAARSAGSATAGLGCRVRGSPPPPEANGPKGAGARQRRAEWGGAPRTIAGAWARGWRRVHRGGGRGPPRPVERPRFCAGAGLGCLCRENRPQDRLGIVGGWWGGCRGG